MMKPIKSMSIVLEGSTYVTSSDVLLFTIRLLYDKMKTKTASPYRNAFVRRFKRKLLSLVDDVNQFYSWAMCAFLDGRRSHLEWLQPVWSNSRDWTNVARRWTTLAALKRELMAEVGNMVSGSIKLL